MEKEYDLMNELGRGNWIDAIAGEAVVVGFALREPELEIKGTELAAMVVNIKYDDDEFYKVEAYARGLELELERVKKERDKTIFLDKVRKSEEEKWPIREWEYDFLCVKGRYQIWLNLPVYTGVVMLVDKEKVAIESAIRRFFVDSTFESYEYSYEESICQDQKFRVKIWHDGQGRMVREIINHDHGDDGISKGWLERYYFDDFKTAATAWHELRKITG